MVAYLTTASAAVAYAHPYSFQFNFVFCAFLTSCRFGVQFSPWSQALGGVRVLWGAPLSCIHSLKLEPEGIKVALTSPVEFSTDHQVSSVLFSVLFFFFPSARVGPISWHDIPRLPHSEVGLRLNEMVDRGPPAEKGVAKMPMEVLYTCLCCLNCVPILRCPVRISSVVYGRSCRCFLTHSKEASMRSSRRRWFATRTL